MREDDPAEPHRRETVVRCSKETGEKSSNPQPDIGRVAGPHVGMCEAYHESGVRCIASTRIHEHRKRRFRFRDSAGLQGRVNLSAREFRLAGKALYGFVPELRVVDVSVGDGREQAAKMEPAAAVNEGQTSNKSRRKSAT